MKLAITSYSNSTISFQRPQYPVQSLKRDVIDSDILNELNLHIMFQSLKHIRVFIWNWQGEFLFWLPIQFSFRGDNTVFSSYWNFVRSTKPSWRILQENPLKKTYNRETLIMATSGNCQSGTSVLWTQRGKKSVVVKGKTLNYCPKWHLFTKYNTLYTSL